MYDWLKKHQEGVSTFMLFALGVYFIWVSGWELLHGLETIKEILKEIGFACIVACGIKFINEKFLRQEIKQSFDEYQHAIAHNVLDAIFEKIIPKELFSELRRTIFGGLEFMREKYDVIFDIKNDENGNLVLTTYTNFRVQNVLGKESKYPFGFGMDEESTCTKEMISAHYSYDSEFNEPKPIPFIKTRVDRFGENYDECTYKIDFPKKKNRLNIQSVIKQTYTDNTLTKDSYRYIFLIPTSNVSVRIQSYPDDMEFKISQFGSDEFIEIKHDGPYKLSWRYYGCFYPHQGFILSWEKKRPEGSAPL